MKYSITIPKPCHENWNEMTPSEKGMFCSSCKKEVIDFTGYSNYGMRKLLNTNERLCGRFRPEQLNKEYSSLNNKSLISGGIAFGLVSLLSLCTPAQAQTQNTTSTIEISEQLIGVVGMLITEEISETTTINGVVKDENNLPLPGANIVLKGISEGVQTDLNGNFSISIPTEKISSKYTLTVSYIGYNNKEIIIEEYEKNINIIMTKTEQEIMGEIIVIGYSDKKK